MKFLGVHIDNHLTFSANVDSIVFKTNSRLFLLRQFKILSMDHTGLKTFYCINIRSVLSYSSPAWYFLLSKSDQDRLENIQRTATHFIVPDEDYTTRLNVLELSALYDFIYGLSQKHFSKITSNPNHALNNSNYCQRQ